MANFSKDSKPAIVEQKEADPYAEFKKSKAYNALFNLGAINDKCEILRPYFRVEHIEETDDNGAERRGTKVFNVVFKLLAVHNTIKPTIMFLSKSHSKDMHTSRGNLDGSLWTWSMSRATEADYKKNKDEDRGYYVEVGGMF